MKTVYLIRHAKSSWEDSTLRDVDRPLNRRGLRDAPFMAKMLAGNGVIPDLIMTSPANRAHTTACFFAEELGINSNDLQIISQIYEAYTNDILELIVDLKDAVNVVFIFGHNPTITSLANMFSGDYIPNVPTCGIVKLESTVVEWKNFSDENTKRTAFYFPKQYL